MIKAKEYKKSAKFEGGLFEIEFLASKRAQHTYDFE